MTYRELLYSVTFADIIPYLKHYHHTERLFGHKQHYDILNLLTPVETNEEDEKYKTIKIEKYDEPADLPLSLEGQIWEEALAKEIMLPEEIEIPLAEVAACCIWGHRSMVSHIGIKKIIIGVGMKSFKHRS